MHARAIIVAGLLIAAIPLDNPAQGQLSPQGIIGGVTRPLRQMLGHFGHFPRNYRHRSSSGARVAAPAAAAAAARALRLGSRPTRRCSGLRSGPTITARNSAATGSMWLWTRSRDVLTGCVRRGWRPRERPRMIPAAT